MTVFVLGCWTFVHAQSDWPMPVNASRARGPIRLELAPDLVHVDLPVNHAKLMWFVTVRELPRPGIEPMKRIELSKMMDQNFATPTVFSAPRKYEIVVDLQRVVVVDRLTFITDVPGCPMSVRVAGADLSQDEGKAWREVGNAETQAPFTKFKLGNEPIRFIHLVLDTTKAPKDEPLHIYEFCVFGQEDLRDYVLKQVPEKERKAREEFVLSSNVGNFPPEMLQPDLASLDAGASVRHLGAGPNEQKISYMLDDDPETTWKPDPSEKETLVLLDFGSERTLNHLDMMHSTRPGKLLVYALQHLPLQKPKIAQLAWIERLTDVPLFRFALNTAAAANGGTGITSDWLAAQTPFGSVDTADNNFPAVSGDLQAAHYMVFRYQNPTPGLGEPLMFNGIKIQGNYPSGEFVLMPRALPIIAGAGGAGGVGAPDGGTTGLPLAEQLNDDRPVVEPPAPNPATP